MEIIIFIIVAVVFYIFILPFINTFGSNSEHKDSGKIAKTKEAFKQVGSNYKETKTAVSKGFSALEKGLDALEKDSRTWNEKAKKYCLEEHEKGYHRAKAKVEEVNKEYRELGLKEVSLIDFFEYNKDYQERARKELEALESKKRAERLLLLIEEHNKSEIESKYKELKTKFENINAERRKTNQPPCDVKKFFGYKPEFLELALKDYPPVLQKISKPIDVELEKLPAELVEFIYIRYYLTGDTSLPKLKCIYDAWTKISYADSELNEAQWIKIIEKMSFNPVKRKKIDALYHFTHKDNLASILNRGLLTKQSLEEQSLKYKFNDEQRLEGVKDSISLSFSHPNWKMFGKYRNLIGQNDFVVLKISPELLSGNTDLHHKHLDDFDYLDKAIFCKKNAANQIESKKSILERKSHKVFLDIFESTIDIELLIYPYLNESEILYQGDIPKEFIKEIHVIEEDLNWAWVHDLGFKVSVNQTVFEKR